MAEPTQRRTDDNGGKWYEHPTRTEPVPERPEWQRPARYVSVTQALSVKNKPALVFWSANLAAARAMNNLPRMMASILVKDCGRSAARKEPYGCGDCLACVQRWVALFHVGEKERRAREGTAAHDIFERWILTGEWIYVRPLTGDADIDQYVPTHEVMAPYITALKAFVADYGLLPEDFAVAECTVWNHRLKYAGTLDAIVTIHPRTKKAAELCARINAHNTRHVGLLVEMADALPAPVVDLLAPVVVLVDLKSREGEDAAIYSEYVLQLTGYRNAETMTPKGGTDELPMLSTDAAAILQARFDPETGAPAYTFRPVLTTGREMRAFEALVSLYRWDAEWGDECTLVRAFPLPDGWTPPVDANANTKAAPRKRATKKATPAKKAAPAAVDPSPTTPAPRSGAILASMSIPGLDNSIPGDGIPF